MHGPAVEDGGGGKKVLDNGQLLHGLVLIRASQGRSPTGTESLDPPKGALGSESKAFGIFSFVNQTYLGYKCTCNLHFGYVRTPEYGTEGSTATKAVGYPEICEFRVLRPKFTASFILFYFLLSFAAHTVGHASLCLAGS